MPRLLCIGADQPQDDWANRVGRTPAYKIGSVQCTNTARYKVIALPYHTLDEKAKVSAKAARGDPLETADPVQIEAEGVVDLTRPDDESGCAAVRLLSKKVEARHNNTFVFHGLAGTGKTVSLRRVVHSLLSGARRHIDTSARESKAARERQQSQAHILNLRKSRELEVAEMKSFAESHEQRQPSDTPPPSAPAPPASAARRSSRRASLAESPRRTDARRGSLRSPVSGDGGTRSAGFGGAVEGGEGGVRKPSSPLTGATQRKKSISFACDAGGGGGGGGDDDNADFGQFQHNLGSHAGHARRQSIGLCDAARSMSAHRLSFGQDGQRKSSAVISATELKRVGGGRSGETLSLDFSAEKKSAVMIPPIVTLEDKAVKCMFELWLKTTEKERRMCVMDIADTAGHCRASVHLNVDHYGDPSPSTIRFHIRDACHKVIECHTVVPTMYDGEWHMLQLHCVSSKDNLIEIRMDGVARRLSLSGQSDEPYLFATWEQAGALGAELPTPLTKEMVATVEAGAAPQFALEHCFDGSIAEFRAWDMQHFPASLLSHCPMNEGLHHNTVKDLVSGGEGAVLSPAKWTTNEFPQTALRFKGNSFVNVGTLGSFGKGLTDFGVEVWFRTVEKKRVMSLLKVTDSQKKHMCIGITLNVNGKGEAQEGYITVQLRDAAGRASVASWAPQGNEDVCDGQWHHIQWRVEDSQTNSMYVKVDNRVRDLAFASRGNPSAFCNFVDYVAVGAHNNRGRLGEFFDGMLRNVVVSSCDAIVAAWKLDEGPGARFAADSGDPMRLEKSAEVDIGYHHGVFKTVYPAGREKTTHQHVTEWLTMEMPDEKSVGGAMQRQQDKKDLSLWASNTVLACCLAVEAVPKPQSSLFLETLRDVVHGRTIQLQAPALSAQHTGFCDDTSGEFAGDEPAAPGEGVAAFNHFENLPDSVWERFDDTDSLLTFFDETVDELEMEGTTKGHHIWIIRIGDAYNTFIDMAGVLQHPSATFDSRTGRWFSATTSMGLHHRFYTCLNKGSSGLLSLCSEVGTFPMLWLRAAQKQADTELACGGGGKEDAFHTRLWNDGYVTRIMKTYGLLSAPVWSNLYFLHTSGAGSVFSKVELDYSRKVLADLGVRGQEMATGAMRKLAQKICLRNRAQELRQQLKMAQDRRRRSTMLLSQFPAAGAKARRIAIVVTSWRPFDARMPRYAEIRDCGARAVDLLTQLRFEVYHLDSSNKEGDDTPSGDAAAAADGEQNSDKLVPTPLRPTAANIRRVVARAVEVDALVFMYVACVSGGSGYYSAPPVFPARYALYVEEEAARDAAVSLECEDFRVLRHRREMAEELLKKSGHEDLAGSKSRSPSIKRASLAYSTPDAGHRGSLGKTEQPPQQDGGARRRSRASMSPPPHNRVEPGSGGAGKRSEKKGDAGKQTGQSVTPRPESQCAGEAELLMEHSSERAELAEQEGSARGAVDEAEMGRWVMLGRMAEELRMKQADFTSAPAHLMVDDSPFENTGATTLPLAELVEALLPKKPVVGVHRMLCVDAYSWKAEAGFFSASTSSAEEVTGTYTHRAAHGLLTHHLLQGLSGHAQLPDTPIATPEERLRIDFPAICGHLVRRLQKEASAHSTLVVDEACATGELVGETILCDKILRPPDAWRVDKAEEARVADHLRAARDAERRRRAAAREAADETGMEDPPGADAGGGERGQVLYQYWADLAYNAGLFDPTAFEDVSTSPGQKMTDIERTLHDALRAYGGCARTEHTLLYAAPVLDVTFPNYTVQCCCLDKNAFAAVTSVLAAVLGSDATTIRSINRETENLLDEHPERAGTHPTVGYTLTSSSTPCLLPLLKDTAFPETVKQGIEVGTRECLCLRFFLKGAAGDGDCRARMPPSAGKARYDASVAFLAATREKVLAALRDAGDRHTPAPPPGGPPVARSRAGSRTTGGVPSPKGASKAAAKPPAGAEAGGAKKIVAFLTGYAFARYKAPKVAGCRIAKKLRRGEELAGFFEGCVSVCGGGLIPVAEGYAYEKACADAVASARQSVADERRRERDASRAERERERTEKITAEAENRIATLILRLANDERSLTSSAVRTLFSLAHAATIGKACECLLSHSGTPDATPGAAVLPLLFSVNPLVQAPMTHADKDAAVSHRRSSLAASAAALTPPDPAKLPLSPTHKPKGFKFIRQCVEWGLYDLLHASLAAGTADGGFGEDSGDACAAVLKLVCGVYYQGKAQFAAHSNISSDVITTLRRHCTHPGVVRWGFNVLCDVAGTGTMSGLRKRSCITDCTVLLRMACVSLYNVAPHKDLPSIVEALSAIALACDRLGQHTEEGDLVTSARLAIATLQLLPEHAKDVAADESELVDHCVFLSLRALNAVTRHSNLVDNKLLLPGDVDKQSPYDLPVPNTLLNGPGVYVCSRCEKRYVKKLAKEGDCAASNPVSNPKGKHHSTLRADDDQEHTISKPWGGEDEGTYIVDTPKHAAFSPKVLLVVERALRLVKTMAEAATEGVVFLAHLTGGVCGEGREPCVHTHQTQDGAFAVYIRSHLVQNPEVLEAAIDAFSAVQNKLSDDDSGQVAGMLVDIIGGAVVDTPSLSSTPLLAMLRGREVDMRDCVLEACSSEVDQSLVERLGGLLSA